MAKQSSIFTLNGTIGNVTFYKSKNGYLAKEKTSVTGDRIKTDPGFQRTRENMSEFGKAGKAGKTLRNALRTVLLSAKDKEISSRLTQEMMKVIKSDVVSPRGQRNILTGEVRILEGFSFNEHAHLSNTLFAPYTVQVNRVSGDISVSIPSFIPEQMLEAPAGATHFQISAAAAEVDFVNDLYNAKDQSSAYLPIDAQPTVALNLVNTVTPASTNALFATLGVQFYQLVNGRYYALKNGGYNAMGIVKVDA